MLRPSNILTAAALALCWALAPAAAADLFTDAERKLVESPEVQGMVDRVSSEIPATPAVVEVRAPSGGFDWGDAGIGAAGMLALFQHRGRSGAPDRRPPSPPGGQRGDPMSQAEVDQGRSASRPFASPKPLIRSPQTRR